MRNSKKRGSRESLIARIVDWRKLSANNVWATVLGVLAGLCVNLAASAIYAAFGSTGDGAEWRLAAILMFFALMFALAAVAKARLIIYVRNELGEDETRLEPHGAVILGLSVVSDASKKASAYAADVSTWVASNVTLKGTRAILEAFVKNPHFHTRGQHSWQAAVKALLPHIVDVPGSGPRVPPIFILTSKATDKTDGSDDEYGAFEEAFQALFAGFNPPLQMTQDDGINFEDFNPLRDRIQHTLNQANKRAKNAPDEVVVKKAIIDVTGAPRPFAIAAASLTLENKTQLFTYVSQADGSLRKYNLIARSEQIAAPG